jgi:hypothetical protein
VAQRLHALADALARHNQLEFAEGANASASGWPTTSS